VQTELITDICDWTDATALINANEYTVVWYTFYYQQLLQDHIASYNANKKTCNIFTDSHQQNTKYTNLLSNLT